MKRARAAAALPAPAEITIRGAGRHRGVDERRLGPWLQALVAELAPAAESFGVRFVGDGTMRALNRDFRGKDATTDVLSFPVGATPDGHHLGDVAISVPAARRQAIERGHPVAREIRLLLVHGVLHCLGHDHETDDGGMERLERRLRRRWLDR